jgi:hypothetical protein
LKIARELAERDPANTGWQRDLSLSLDKIGDIKIEMGDRAAALAAYDEAAAITRRLVAIDASNAGWKFDMVVGLYKIAMATDGSRRAAAINEALDIAVRLEADGALAADRQGLPDELRAMLAR